MMRSLNKLKVVIGGGSLSGCAMAILLSRLGAEVKLLERTRQPHVGRGAGVVLPESFINQCIKLDLFDENIPRVPFLGRSFFVKDKSYADDKKKIWNQPAFSGSALNWSDVYHNLRKRIPDNNYLLGEEINNITRVDNSCFIQTASRKLYQADLLVAADGVNSFIRSQIFPEVHPNYAGYIAWRGVISKKDLGKHPILDKHVSYFVYPNGHLLMYEIPSINGDTMLNWVMYEDCRNTPLSEILIDKNNIKYTSSLPPGSLSASHIQHLHTLAKNVLPDFCSQIIIQTENPFLQAISDICVPAFVDHQICFVGDAASVLRPHTSSGVLKGITDAIKLFELLGSKKHEDINSALNEWGSAQLQSVSHQMVLAKKMGDGLVVNTPNWNTMNSLSMDQWWQEIMEGKNWYTTSNSALFWKNNPSSETVNVVHDQENQYTNK